MVNFHGEGYIQNFMFQTTYWHCHILIEPLIEDKWKSWSQGKVWKISDRMARDLMRNPQKNSHIAAKELQKNSSKQRSCCSLENNPKQSTQQRPTWLSCQKGRPQHKIKHLNYAKENSEKPEAFWYNVLWTDETEIKLFGHHQRRYVWTKNGEGFVEKNILPNVKHVGGSIYGLGLCGSWGTGNIVLVEEWIPANIKKF